ncbi:unnamed protein product [Vitrella brassicaformis CCMP3155]|uniref:Barstar (barnase inhibitor) domain-containing protein n=1 Tax=Vitrella brassicaformis (strain CCMP3155) TaxID=1169540 RepID=A0A0G4GTX5_VITBC|nr:unnamed protein product [Vitrella brassicaformis CCMP3155]|eukprot:CEM34215.1 unnamed protein product [Vitrella brassicaformis CCMP3155]
MSQTTDKPIYEIDGADFSTLDGFYDALMAAMPLPSWFGRNLDALNDVFREYFWPDGPFVLVWKNHELSKEHFNYYYHPSHEKVLFDLLVEIMTEGDGEVREWVELRLE